MPCGLVGDAEEVLRRDPLALHRGDAEVRSSGGGAMGARTPCQLAPWRQGGQYVPLNSYRLSPLRRPKEPAQLQSCAAARRFLASTNRP